MDITIEIDLGQAARELNLPLESVQSTVALLDEGNTVPFITRYRKDHTGALDEEQIRRIQEKVGKLRGLAERKQTILKSVQSQGVLTPDLVDQIRSATSLKRLEDLYLPFKPKKQTFATSARQRGLEPLAQEVLAANPTAADLQQRAGDFVLPEKDLHSVEEVFLGVRHIIAEWFSERADVRGRLRKILQRTGKLHCSRIESPKQGESPVSPTADVAGATKPTAEEAVAGGEVAEALQTTLPEAQEPPQSEIASALPQPPDASADASLAAKKPPREPTGGDVIDATSTDASPAASVSLDPEPPPPEQSELARSGQAMSDPEQPTLDEPAGSDTAVEAPMPDNSPAAPSSVTATETPVVDPPLDKAGADKPMVRASQKKSTAKRGPLSAAITKKEKKRQRLQAAFKDYYDFQESISRIPPHRVLAINRGERARILRVKIDADAHAMEAAAEQLLIADDHPHREFLTTCVRDALGRLLLPSLDRELRREMTEKAEEHAVEVFARNLRKLLLQPPVQNHRVLAIDPGFRSGCKLISLDEFGNVLDHEIIHVIGKEEWIRTGRNKLIDLVRRNRLSVVAIGNGAACRETEQLVVDVMEKELKEDDVAFVIVNEAGASVYSTSPLGREELPTYDAVLRSAISIGRRLLDPLSELVKINPANIGVGMYQHDVKAKHLRNSLDAVVESCVNYVGVDVNTASPALLRYVSGMNQLTARRLCEFRAKNGPFRSREQLKQVPGLGEATFVQAAGFLKIAHGDNPLDATWIHPESYALARQVLEKSGCSVEDLRVGTMPTSKKSSKPLEFGSLDPGGATDAAEDAPVALPRQETAAVSPPADTTAGEDITGEEATVELPPKETADPNRAVADAVASPREGSRAEADTPAPNDLAAGGSQASSLAEALAPSPAGGAAEQQAVPDAILPGAILPGAILPEDSLPDGRPPEDRASEDRASEECAADRLRVLYEKVYQLDVPALAGEWSVSEILLQDILNSLARPGRDPREDLPAPVFRHGIVKLEDLEPGMKLSGTVLNVVDFGVFVDIGLSDSGLVHISRLADRFVRDPHEVVGVGDVLTVWVVDIDKQRRRVSLTAIEPGTEKPADARRRPDKSRPRKPAGKRPPRAARGGQEVESRGKGRPSHDQSRERGRPPRKPKIVKPITKEMEEGKEPLRSFSDLMQFYQKKQNDGNESSS